MSKVNKMRIEITNEHGVHSCQMQGEMIELLAGLCYGIAQIHTSLPDEESRRSFRLMVLQALADPSSPVWDTTEDGTGTRIVTKVPRREREDE